MPSRAPSVCPYCGKAHLASEACATVVRMRRERKARFDKKRPCARKRGYTREWEKAAREFLASFPKCRRCDRPADLVDHIKPHKGDMRIFWDQANWQGLCTHHHNSAKQSEERRAPKGY